MTDTSNIFNEQVETLSEAHFLVLLWLTHAEDQKRPYNVTNCFDDLKYHGVTRTKQNAVAIIETLKALRFVDEANRGNRKNLYITAYGAKALEYLIHYSSFTPRKSLFLERSSP